MPSLLVYGCGAQGRVVLEILRAAVPRVPIGFLDDDVRRKGKEILGASVAGGERCLLTSAPGTRVVIAVGHPVLRMRLFDRLHKKQCTFSGAIHPSAVIVPSARIGASVNIGALAVVNTEAIIGDAVIINTAAVVEHDCCIGDGATICPGAHIGGRARIGKGAFIGTGAIILSRLTVGAGSVVAAGAVVTKDVPENVLVRGVPARPVEKIRKLFDWDRLL